MADAYEGDSKKQCPDPKGIKETREQRWAKEREAKQLMGFATPDEPVTVSAAGPQATQMP